MIGTRYCYVGLRRVGIPLRGRAAPAHDFNPDHAVAPTFLTLPGSSFVVNGAAQARDAALTAASAEVKWRNGVAIGATFEGEFFQCHPQPRRQGNRALCVVNFTIGPVSAC